MDALDSGLGRARALARRGPPPADLARIALGATILLAGGHKLVDPEAWAVYVVDPLVPWLVVSPATFMLINGVLEVGVGLAVLADRYTALAAGVVALSLTATVGYLAAVWTLSGRFGDVLVRDAGLAGLAWAVTSEALRRE